MSAVLSGQACLVTGGGSGIGRAIALALAGAGADVVVCGRRQDALAATVRLAAGLPGRVRPQPLDVRDADGTATAVRAALSLLGGRLQVLVNNAGTGGPNGCASPGPDRWDEIIRTNLDGLFFVTRTAAPALVDGGRVINVSSVLGKFGVPGYTAYCASKHGVIGFTKALALEVAPRRITVNAICPGWVETEMARQGMELLAQGQGTDYATARAEALARVPLGRIIEPGEVAELVLFLVGPGAAGMTGQAISLCGGATMG